MSCVATEISSQLSDQLVTIQKFLKCLEAINLPVCFEELSVHLGACFRRSVYSSAFASTSCFCRASRGAMGKSIVPSPGFPEYAHSNTHVHKLLNSQEYVRVFQSPYGLLIALLSFQALWLISGLCKLLTITSGILILKYLPVNVFHKCPGGDTFSIWASLSEVK